MKVLIYSEYFFPVTGGVQTIVFELACGLAESTKNNASRDPVDVTVVTRTAGRTVEEERWPFRLVRRPSLVKLIRLIGDADVIHLAGPALLPMALGLALGKPVVVEHHGYQSVCPNGLLLIGASEAVTGCPGHFMARRYNLCLACNSKDMGWSGSLRALTLQFPRRWLCRLVSSNVAVTDHVARRIALPRTRTILHGIRDPGFQRPCCNGKTIRIGYVGRLVREKGLSLLLKAGKRLKDDGFTFQIIFVGEGPLRKELERESNELGLAERVTFTGELFGADLEKAVRRLQVLVMPSLWEETAGLAAIEQMMRGGVVIASDIGGLSEIVGDAGLKFAPGDAEALYLRLRKMFEDPSIAASLPSSARERAELIFNRDTMIQKHVSVYQEVAR